MRVTYTDWDDDHHRPVDVKTIEGYFEGDLPLLAIDRLPDKDQVRLSFSIVGLSWDIDIEHTEWGAVRDRIDSLFNSSLTHGDSH